MDINFWRSVHGTWFDSECPRVWTEDFAHNP